ncbi:MAG: diguanylate cyclase [Nitrospirae bacterium]|nr:diguanylate cyclase [Nitrospirota bacterium]
MTHPSDAVQEKLKGLRKIFLGQLQGKIREIEEAWASLLRDGWDQGRAEAVTRLLHTMAGTAGTFGFSAIRVAAKTPEARIRAGIREGGNPSISVLAEITEYLTSLRDACGDAAISTVASQVTMQVPSSARSDNDTVFVVDSDPLFVDGLALQLRCYGYKVAAFSSFAGFIEAWKASMPLLIVMELSFLGDLQTGADAIAELQQRQESPIPVVFLSDRVDFNSRLEAVRAGGTAFFVKPMDVGHLVDILDALTTRRPRHPFRILIVDDDPLLADFHATVLLQAGMKAAVVTEPEQALESMIDFRPELILMDVYMPGCSGMELARLIRQDETYIDIPIVFLSSETDIDRQLAAMGRGGDDFLTKPIQPARLITSVTLRADRYRTLRSFMLYDGLTGLLNHTRTKEQLDVEVSRVFRQKAELSFALIDIDHFKLVNDTYGHPVGDQVLKSLSRLLKQRLRTTDIVGRFGGEEFAVILTDTDGQTAHRILNELREDFAKICHTIKDGSFNVTFSCGIACPEPGMTGTALINEADRALYEAKRAGRNCVVCGGAGEASTAC